MEAACKATSIQMQNIMTKSKFQELLDRYFNGIVSDSERELIDQFYSKSQEIEGGWESFTEDRKKQLRTEIYEAIQKEKNVKEIKNNPFRSWVWKVAASIVLALGTGIAVYLTQLQEPEINYITKSTKRGQKATVTLSDGSIVRLNSESSITYPEIFASLDTRAIKLTGEAFFDVQRNPEKPFIIRSGGVLTTVLGTSFNIAAFPEVDEIEVTVATGRVKVESNSDLVTELIPGQQASFSKLKKALVVSEVDVEKYMAWKDGVIHFPNISFLEASKILERWYDVEFAFDHPELKKCRIKGKFQSGSLDDILSNLMYFMDFNYDLTNKTVKIHGSGCGQIN